jgi:hypothetical protein
MILGAEPPRGGHFDAEAVFDESGVCEGQSILGREASIGPVGSSARSTPAASSSEPALG